MVFLSLLCNTPMLETVVIDQPVLNNHLAVPHGWRLNSGSTVGCIIKVIKNVYIKCFSTFSLQSFKAHLADVLTVCVNKVCRYNKASILLLLLLPLSLLLLLPLPLLLYISFMVILPNVFNLLPNEWLLKTRQERKQRFDVWIMSRWLRTEFDDTNQ